MIDQISDALQKKPGNRFTEPDLAQLPKAAVCMILKLDLTNDQIAVLLAQRRISESDPWSGNVAFPGGKYEESDGEIMNTAKREVMEECGIDVGKCELLGTLDDTMPGNKSIAVTPFVVLAPKSIIVRINEREITGYVWIPIDFFIDKKNSSPMQVRRTGTTHEVASYKYQESYLVWGMTLRIIDDFLSKVL
jgi:8-oxo-dGTP pyrophosphatase MutT (NUDIX family)